MENCSGWRKKSCKNCSLVIPLADFRRSNGGMFLRENAACAFLACMFFCLQALICSNLESCPIAVGGCPQSGIPNSCQALATFSYTWRLFVQEKKAHTHTQHTLGSAASSARRSPNRRAVPPGEAATNCTPKRDKVHQIAQRSVRSKRLAVRLGPPVTQTRERTYRC